MAAGHHAGRREEGLPRPHRGSPHPLQGTLQPQPEAERGRKQVGSGAGVGLRLGRVTTLWCIRVPVWETSFWEVKQAPNVLRSGSGVTRSSPSATSHSCVQALARRTQKMATRP